MVLTGSVCEHLLVSLDRVEAADLGGIDPAAVADEVVRCRRRGLARLDSKVGSEPPVELPLLEMLCSAYFRSKHDAVRDRGVAIGTLLREAAAVTQPDRPEDSALLVELFFGNSGSNVPSAAPGELLDAARRRRARLSTTAFRRHQREVFLRVGQVLMDLVPQREKSAAASPVPTTQINDGPEIRVETSAATVSGLAGNPDTRAELILEHLRGMAAEYEISEVLEVIVRFDTPDITG